MTRTLTLTARGLAGNQIPDIPIPAPPGFRVYPGQTEAETRSDGETLIGISQQQVTLICRGFGAGWLQCRWRRRGCWLGRWNRQRVLGA